LNKEKKTAKKKQRRRRRRKKKKTCSLFVLAKKRLVPFLGRKILFPFLSLLSLSLSFKTPKQLNVSPSFAVLCPLSTPP